MSAVSELGRVESFLQSLENEAKDQGVRRQDFDELFLWWESALGRFAIRLALENLFLIDREIEVDFETLAEDFETRIQINDSMGYMFCTAPDTERISRLSRDRLFVLRPQVEIRSVELVFSLLRKRGCEIVRSFDYGIALAQSAVTLPVFGIDDRFKGSGWLAHKDRSGILNVRGCDGYRFCINPKVGILVHSTTESPPDFPFDEDTKQK